LGKRRFRIVLDRFNNRVLEKEGDPRAAYAIERNQVFKREYDWLRHAHLFLEGELARDLAKSLIVKRPKDFLFAFISYL